MKLKILWGACSILILLITAAFTPPVPEGPLPEQNSSATSSSQPDLLTTGDFLATISPVQGDIYWRQETERDWFNIDNEQGLDAGNQVLTKAEGRAKIEYYDGIIVRVGPHTLFTVIEQTQTEELNLISRIRLLMGQIFIKHGEGYYQGKFEVETPSGVAAVKGTMMSVQINPEGQTLITCLEGVCSLSNDSGELTLTEGQGAHMDDKDLPPQPADIEDWQLNDWIENDPEALSIALHQGLGTQVAGYCDPVNSKNCILEHAATPFIGCEHDGTCIAEEPEDTDAEPTPILAAIQPDPNIPALPDPPEVIIPHEDPIDPIIPVSIIEPSPAPEETPTPNRIGRCPRRHHHR